MTTITVKELKALLADLSDDTIITLEACPYYDATGDYAEAVLSTPKETLLIAEG